MSKKILILTFYYKPDLSAGSFRMTAFVEELKKIVSDNDQIDIITTLPNRYNTFNKNAKKIEKYNNITIYRVELSKHKSGFIDQSYLFLQYAIAVFKILRTKKKYDIVFATSSRLMTAFLGSLVKRHTQAKLYLDIRDIFTDTLNSIFEKSKVKHIIPLFKIVEKYTINSADCINLVSEGFSEYFQNINPNIKYSFYPNGVDEIFINTSFEKKREDKKKVITYAGNIGEGQGLEKIIPNMAKFLGSEYEIKIIGDGGTKIKLANAVKGLENVKIIPPMERSRLLKEYANSDFLFLHLNSYEAFKKVLPSKIFEYAATNKFIIAGVDGYAKEFIEKNVTASMVFTPCDINDFKSKFNKIVEVKIDRREFVKKFSRKNIMKKLAQEVYAL
ncbi:glycosyltransferase family 4 protein [Nitrosophilus labii]|uniref:glycosyltransferase family 4 protein n=1 Tax=Nitrosophilus labii TaxID=2706014 RepID=UPI0016570178|nr:glycosyltransferase family 4 protein [Nitrosophilus labii]